MSARGNIGRISRQRSEFKTGSQGVINGDSQNDLSMFGTKFPG
jgi:hypothetical protein